MANVPVFRRGKQIDSPEADFAEELRRFDPLSLGGLVDHELKPTTGVQYVPHKLGRAYRGAIVVGTSVAGWVSVQRADLARDPEQRVAVFQQIAAPNRIRLLVF